MSGINHLVIYSLFRSGYPKYHPMVGDARGFLDKISDYSYMDEWIVSKYRGSTHLVI